MKRKLREQEVEEIIKDPSKEIVPDRMKKLDFKPYTGKDDLPKATVHEKKVGNHTVLIKEKNGEPRFFLERRLNGIYKLIQVFSTGKGTASRMIQILKTLKKDERGIRDRKLLRRLRECNIPGA